MNLVTMILLALFGLDSFNHRSDPPSDGTIVIG